MGYIKLSAREFNKKLKGQVISKVNFFAFPDGRGGEVTHPIIYLEGDARINFIVEETDVDSYGVKLLFHSADKHFEYKTKEGK